VIRKINLSQLVNTLANIGVIAGIAFLAFELNQNNVLLQLEAEATRVEIVLDGWNQIVNEPGFAELLIKDRSSASRAAGKDNFTAEFVRIVDENIFIEHSKIVR
jgi:hypothetical protein